MAEAAILSVGLCVVQEILGSGMLKKIKMISGVRGDVEKLRSNLSAIEAVLADANWRRVKERFVDDWLKKVRDVAYQVDDVLDDFRFEALRREAEIGDHALKKVARSWWSTSRWAYVYVARSENVVPKSLWLCLRGNAYGRPRELGAAKTDMRVRGVTYIMLDRIVCVCIYIIIACLGGLLYNYFF
ncbi:hypothetical protein QJS10_CPB17g01530 [Acorus calamus]|uniref:Disease resistance N-terminal domain-containing protein n=1 Tax=Acorus calamus TaxID=4465 RepID=A0AAV9CU77_ACOCL|nr:hypothetical protein QJS10_CPB17g01530 [Acorus calamus]